MDTSGLAPRDAAFAHAIEDAVMRRWLTLQTVLQQTLRRPFESLDPRVRGALLAGAGQMLFMAKVPARAAINEAVEWAKRACKPEVGALVNASLRGLGRLLERAGGHVADPIEDARTHRGAWTNKRDELPLSDGRAVVFAADVLPPGSIERAALATGHAPTLVRRWADAFGEPEAVRLAHHSVCDPPVILTTRYAADATDAGSPGVFEPHTAAGSSVYVGAGSDLGGLLERRPDLWAQDPASACVVEEIARTLPDRPRLILDLCAGQGTKARHLARAFPDARVVATDVDERRFAMLRALAARTPGLEVVSPEAAGLVAGGAGAFNGAADLVLLDVPCSNTGVLPRRPEAKVRFDRGQMDRLTALQREILRAAVPLLAGSQDAGGTIVYSTCSLEREENEDQAAWAATLGLRVVAEHRTTPGGLPGGPAAGYSDGGYWVALRR